MILFAAWRQVIHRQKQTLASIASIFIGVSLSIMMLSMQLGFENDFIERIIAVTPHVQVTSERLRQRPDFGKDRYEVSQILRIKAFEKSEVINGAGFWEGRLASVPGVLAISRAYTGQGLIGYGNKDQAAVIRGIDPVKETIINDFSGKLRFGNLDHFSVTRNGIVLGSGIARRIGARTGNTVTLVSDNGNRDLYRVIDIYQSGITAYDNRTAFVLLKNAESFFGATGPNEFSIKLTDPNTAEKIARELRELTGLDTKDWISENENIRAELNRRRLINTSIVGTIFAVSAFGIANIMFMNVLNKKRDIAIMQAFGVSRTSLVLIYIAQGAILGLLGSLLGILGGALLVYALSILPVSFNATITREGFPVVWSMSVFFLPASVGFLAGIIASIFPAWRASRLHPAEVIRNG